MLNLPGNSEVAFARLNTINAVPLVWMEWNYNTLLRPYVVTSQTSGVLSAGTALNNASNWASKYSGNISLISSGGPVFETDANSGSCLLMSSAAGTEYDLATGTMSLTSTGGSYYKIVMYVKANQANVTGVPAQIPGTSITTTASGPTSFSVPGANGTTGKNYLTFPVTSASLFAGVNYGASISVTGVPAGTTITSINSNPARVNGVYTSLVQIGMSAAASATFTNRTVSISQSNTVSYRIVPVSGNNSRPMYDPYGNDNSSPLTTTSASVVVKWPAPTNTNGLNNPKSFDIYRNSNFVGTLPVSTSTIGSDNKYFFVDNLFSTALEAAPIPSTTNRIGLTPSIKLYNSSNNYVESTKYFTRFMSEETGTMVTDSQSMYIDGAKYYRVEVFFGSDDAFNKVHLDLAYQGIYGNCQILVSKIELYQIDQWNFVNTQYFPIESVFNSNRTAESLLHPYIQSNDTYINKNTSSSVSKPVSLMFNSPDYWASNLSPFIQAKNSIFNGYKYYVSPSKSMSSTTTVYAKYNNFLTVNKIVVKMAPGGAIDSPSDKLSNVMSGISGSVLLLGPNYSVIQTIPFPASSINRNGLMVLTYNGTSWTINDSSWSPPSLTDSGVVQNVTSSVTGIAYVSNTPQKWGSGDYDRTHIVEISPRFEIDVSNIVESADINKKMDDSDLTAGFPIGYMNSNDGKITLHNIPVYRNGFPHSIFDGISKSATFSDLLRENVKFTVVLKSPNYSFTDTIPYMTMYSDAWHVNDLNDVEVDLFDTAKAVMMGMESPPYLSLAESTFSTITNILEISGFSDYDYDGLKDVMSRKTNVMTAFWCDKDKTLFDTLKSLFVANQIGAAFDEYGIMRFYDIDRYIYQITNNTFAPDFLVTDVPQTLYKPTASVFYESNIAKGGYSAQLEKKVGKIRIEFQTPSRHYTEDRNKNSARETYIPRPVYTQNDEAWLPNAMLTQSVGMTDSYCYIDRNNLFGDTVYEGVDYNGYGFMQGELVKWSGLEFKYTAVRSDGRTLPIIIRSVTSYDQHEVQIQEMFSADPSVVSVTYEPTGKIVGLERGVLGTSPRDHFVYTSHAQATSGHRNATNSDPFIISGTSGGNSVVYDGHDMILGLHSNVALEAAPATSTLTSDYVTSTAANNFHCYSMLFRLPDLTNAVYDASTSVGEIGMFFGIYTITLKHNFVNNQNTCTIETHDLRISNGSKEIDNVFDGKPHRLTIYRFGTEGTQATIFIDRKFVCTITFPSDTFLRQHIKTTWGIHAKNNRRSSPTKFIVHELYACEAIGGSLNTADNYSPGRFDYHWQNPLFLNKLIKNVRPVEPKYFIWGPVRIMGVKYYKEEKYNLFAPIIENSVVVDRDFGYATGQAPTGQPPLYGKKYGDLSVSTIFSTPFRFTTMVVNNSRDEQPVLLQTPSKKINGADITPFGLDADFLKLSEQGPNSSVEKIISPTNVNNSTTLTTTWIQSKIDAENLLQKIEFLSSPFSTTINLKMFGNPLIQVGDICQLTYTVKKIGYDPENPSVSKVYCIVKEANNAFKMGLDTTLVLKPLFTPSSITLQ